MGNFKAQLTELSQRVFREEDVAVQELAHAFVHGLAQGILAKSGIAALLREKPCSELEILKALKIKPSCLPALRWLLDFATGYAGSRFTAGARTMYVSDNLDLIASEILRYDPSWAPVLEYYRSVAEDFPRFFRGEKSGVDIVFGGDRLRYWTYYFGNGFSGYRVVNEFGAIVVADSIRRSGGATVLEIGAGIGGAADAVLTSLEKTASVHCLRSYAYTDVALTFLDNAKRVFATGGRNVPFVAQKLDLNFPFAEQGVAPGTIDLVYSVNSVHLAKDLLASLRQIFASLRPGGSLIIAESVRPSREESVYHEILFTLLSTYTDVQTSRELRPTVGFLSSDVWESAVRHAGFERAEVFTDLAFETKKRRAERIAVVRATKAG